MSLYFQRERKNLETVINKNEIVLFDTPVISSETTPYTESDQPPGIPEPDFEYQADGTIDILREAKFIVSWNIATATGMSTDGQSFQLKKRDYSVVNPAASGAWIELGSGAATFKTSVTTGFTIVEVAEQELTDFNRATIALFNVSDDALKLSKHPHTKAAIIIFNLGPTDVDITKLYEYINELYRFITFSDVHVYTTYSAPFYRTGYAPAAGSEVSLVNSPDANHYQVGVIWSGHTYNFWLISPSTQRSISFAQGTNYYILRAQDFIDQDGNRPLTWYQGQTTFGTVWAEYSNGNYNAFPVMLDNTGIYFSPGSQSSIVNIKFTQTLILTPPT